MDDRKPISDEDLEALKNKETDIIGGLFKLRPFELFSLIDRIEQQQAEIAELREAMYILDIMERTEEVDRLDKARAALSQKVT